MLRHCAYIVTLVPSVLRWRLAETKPGARQTETSVASVRSSMSSLLVCRLNYEHINQGYHTALRRNCGHGVVTFSKGRMKSADPMLFLSGRWHQFDHPPRVASP